MPWKSRPALSTAGHLRLNTSKKRNFRIITFLIIGSFITAHLCCRFLPDLTETWNAQIVDRFFKLRSSLTSFRPPYDDTIVHVDINNTTIQQLNNYYLNRSHHARLTTNLTAMGVALQLYDFIFAAPSNEEYDREFKDATLKAESVYFGMAFKLVKESSLEALEQHPTDQPPYLEQTRWHVLSRGDVSGFFVGTYPLITFPFLASASKGLGYLNLTSDADGVFRRLPLLVRYQGAFYPSFSLRAICDYLTVAPHTIVINKGNTLTLTDARRPGDAKTRNIVIPVDRKGRMIVNYIGPWERMKHYNYVDVLQASEDRDEMDLWKEELAGKIAVISEVSTGTGDIGPVPTDSLFPLSGVQANAMHTILTESFLRELSGREMLVIEATLLLCVLLLSISFSSVYFSLGTLLLAALYVTGTGAAFLWGNTILHIVRPLLMVFFALISIVIFRYIREEQEKMEGLRQRDFIRATFGRYLSHEVVEELLSSPQGLELRGETREVTFLVSDLRGFTSLTATLTPHEVITILNRFLETMVDTIAHYRGTVDEVQGDGLLVFFGAPLSAPDDAERAVACAIEMQNRMQELNREFTRHHLPELTMGIGINTGEVVVGTIGSEKRSKYGAVGTPINMTYRIESYTTGRQILISPETYKKIKLLVQVKQTVAVNFKGIDHPLTLHDVQGIQGTYRITLTAKDAPPLTPLVSPLPVRCFLLEGKTVSEAGIPGYITGLSTARSEALLERAVANHANLKIRVGESEGLNLSDTYAKVVSVAASTASPSEIRVLLDFTFLPEEVKSFLEKKRIEATVQSSKITEKEG